MSEDAKTTVVLSAVNENHVFVEIIKNKSASLEILREAISNSHDYKATEMTIIAKTKFIKGKHRLVITIKDDGLGMDLDGLKRFASLGFSESHQHKINNTGDQLVGEKGHGTLLYFFSDEVYVEAKKDGKCYKVRWVNPWAKVCDGEKLQADAEIVNCSPTDHGTFIEIIGYANDDTTQFAYHIMKDYIEWYTKFGSVENQFVTEPFKVPQSTLRRIKLAGVNNSDEPQMIFFGHPFPAQTRSLDILIDKYLQDAPKYYCKRMVKQGNLPHFPEYKWYAVISLEGDYIKRDINPCLGKKKALGLYNVQDRYGIWLCKDFVPIQRKNEWIVTKGSEFTRYHAFFNCQAFMLTANRGSVESTETKIMQDVEYVIRQLRNDVENSNEWDNWDWLEGQASGEKTRKREETDWKRRLDRVKSKKGAEYKGVCLLEPKQESGVYALLIQTSQLDPDLYPFEIVDYDSHSGYDIVVRTANNRSLGKKHDYKYLELKYFLKEKFNHCFEYLYGVLCWQISESVLAGQAVQDALEIERHLVVVPPEKPGDATKYFLENAYDTYKIPVIVLENYLKEKRDIMFNQIINL
jgi:hypothetical protein